MVTERGLEQWKSTTSLCQAGQKDDRCLLGNFHKHAEKAARSQRNSFQPDGGKRCLCFKWVTAALLRGRRKPVSTFFWVPPSICE